MAVHAGRALFEQMIGDRRGNAQRGSLVYVYLPGTTTLVTLYTDRTKVTEADNPLSTNDLGNLALFADPGDYEALVEDTDVRLKLTVLPDWQDVQDGVSDTSDIIEAMQAELDDHIATPHAHPDLATHLALGLDATD